MSNNSVNISNVKNPSGVDIIVGMLLLILAMTRLLIRSVFPTKTFDIFMYYVGIGLVVMYVVILIVTVIRAFGKPFQIQLNSGSMVVREREIKIEEIREIRTNGYWRPIIGVIPKGKRIVPLHLCFRFTQNRDEALRELSDWARDNQIKISNGHFMRVM